MDDLARKMAAARGDVGVVWTEAQAQGARRGIARGLRRRRHVRVAAAAALVVATAGAAWRVATPAVTTVATVARGDVVAPVPGDEGSTVAPLDAACAVRVRERSAARTVLEVVRGGARFDVAHASARVFRVEAGDVAVQVLGTAFTVERRGARVHVGVDQGRVRVFWADRVVDLGAGEAGLFPREDSAAVPVATVSGATAEEPPATPVPHAVPARTSTWRALAAAGAFERAYEALTREGAGAVRDVPADLLLAADVARGSRQPAEAARYLRRMLARFSRTADAPVAAFTLGRLLLDGLGRPAEAAEAFARARALDARGAVAEDALAREVEAWSRSGDAARARARAEEYLARYPAGRHQRAVQHFGAME